MSTIYSLEPSDQTFGFNNTVQIYRSKTNKSSSTQYFLYIDGQLYNVYLNDNEWQKNLLLDNVPGKIIYFPKTLKDKESLLLLKTTLGIDIYQYSGGKFNLFWSSKEESPFGTFAAWNKPDNLIKCGNIYSDEKFLGIVSKISNNELQFHSLINDDSENPFYPLSEDNIKILNNVTSKVDFYLADLKKKGQEHLIVRSRQGLDIYEFDKENQLHHFLQVPGSTKTNDFQEKIFFPDLTGQSLSDIALFNSSGLFVYQYDDKKNSYQMIHYNPLFDEQRGWNKKYLNTIRFEDINYDGKQEMFFTGPQGMDILTFKTTNSEWQSVLDLSQLAIPQRHSYILDVISPNSGHTNNPIIFMQHRNKLYWAKIVKNQVDYKEVQNSFDELPSFSKNLSVIPKSIKPKISDEDKSILLLRNQVDCSSVINGVDKDTGKASFKLPLIGLPQFPRDEKLNLYYNDNNKGSSILGVGWSFPVNAILLDPQGSILPENERYVLLLENIPQLLTIDAKSSTKNVYNFKLSDKKSKTQIRYFKKEERWEIDFMGTKQIYGRRESATEQDSISYNLAWKYWRGVGSSPSNQVELATAWFLTELRYGENKSIYYTYDVHNELIPESGKKFTREVYLKQINDNEGNEIIFNYAAKGSDEYKLPPLKNEQGNYNTIQVQTQYLQSYSLTTYNYRQNIKFVYKVENGDRLLMRIEQDEDPTNKPILQFFYKKILSRYLLEEAILPTSTRVEFSYETIGGTTDVLENIDLKCNVSNSYSVDYGQDFVLISYINNFHHVVLKMFNLELTKELYSTISQSESERFPFFGNKMVYHHEVKILEGSIAIILNCDTSKQLCLLDQENNKWSLHPKCYNYGKDADIQVGNNFIAIFDTPKNPLKIIVWDQKSKDWIQKTIDGILNENSILKVSGKEFFIYNDSTVTVYYRSKNNEWISKSIITLPRVISSMNDTLHKFNLQDNVYKLLLHHLKKNVLQISNNLLLIKTFNIHDANITSKIKLYTLNSNHDVMNIETHTVFEENLTEISKEEELLLKDDIKISYILGYKKDKEKFKIFVRKFDENNPKKIKEFCKDEKDKNCESDITSNIEQSIKDLHKQDFILNLQKYLAHLQSSMVICDSAKFIFDGNSWRKEENIVNKLKSDKWSISIDEKYTLEKENSQSSIKLHKKDTHEIFDLEIKNMNQTFNMYPKYLAYRTEQEDEKIVFYDLLDNATVKKFPLPKEETLSLKSNYITLITHDKNNSANENLILNLRQVFKIESSVQNLVIKKLTVYFDKDYKRITGYDYDPSSVKLMGDTLFYEKTYVIPGNEKSLYGFTEDTKNTADNLHVTKVFDAQGNLIKTIRNEPLNNTRDSETDDTENTNTVIFDMTGQFEVAQFNPYRIEDNEVSYYGFEDYEINKIGIINSTNENRWFFNESDVLKQEFSLTGENYLKLKNNNLLGLFEPRDQNQTYVASCWLRSHRKDFHNSTFSPYLSATLYTENNMTINSYLSEVKYQYDDWSYLEVVIDLFRSRIVFANLLSIANVTDTPIEKPFKILISVGTISNTTLDVDHIRFSPLNSQFQATTYNLKTKEIKEIVNANGLIKRYFYNYYLDQIASINENGEIEIFNTYTKASSIDRIVEFQSKIEIQSSAGFYEDFRPYAFTKRWEIENEKNWQISPSEIYHTSNQFDQIKLRNMQNAFLSFGIRVYFSLQSDSSVIRFNDILHLERENNKAFITFSKKERRSIPKDGEILLVTEHNRLMVWIDGGLYFDEGSETKLLLNIEIYGKVKVRDVLVLIEPSVSVTYFNALDEKVQEIKLESTNNAVVTEFLYDELGRQCITTKSTRLQRSADQPIVAYYSDYVTNKNPLYIDSVWKIGQVKGSFAVLNPYDYYEETYNNNPLSEKLAVGMPGQEFSIHGKFAKRFSWNTENAYIKEHYPIDQDYRHYVEYKPGGIEYITVYDKMNNKVATLVKAPGEKDSLATYKYNNDGKLIEILSPLYHNTATTSHKLSFHQCYSKESNENPNSLRVTNSYDKKGNLIIKTSPDFGTVEYLYNDDGQLRYNIFYSSFNSTVIENVIYFEYDDFGRLSSTGKLILPSEKEKLLNVTITENNAEEYQLFYPSDFEKQPIYRGRLQRTITHNDGIPFIEESLLDEDKSISSKRVIVIDENSEEPLVIAINKVYSAGKVIEIEYPIYGHGETFKVKYHYDKLGRIEGIGSVTENNLFVKYSYNADGLIETEHHLPDQINLNFTRYHKYNSASFLTQLHDKFLTENIYYTTGSYGDRGHSDGTVTRTEFEANWHQYADDEKITLNEQSFVSKFISHKASKLCFNKLKAAGYINQNNHQDRIYYPNLEMNFPRICSEGIPGRQIQNILGKQGFPLKYGHLYSYGAYQELTKAKYFVGKEIPAPLQPDTFSKLIANVSISTSHDIWKLLNNEGYIISDRISNNMLNDDNSLKPHGKKGISFIQSKLFDNLKDITGNYVHYRLPLENALAFYFSKRQDFSSLELNLKKSFSEWQQNSNSNVEEILNMLKIKGYFQNPLDEKFNNILKKYQTIVPEIVDVLFQHFGTELGEAEFDVEAYEIDENGNHKHFYNGFDRYMLEYHCNSNQIHRVKVQSFASSSHENEYVINHDSRGNVIQALHKGIKNISYHPVSNRVTSVELLDGKKLIFRYDTQGERVLKRVFDTTGELKKEINYVRDEFGRTLVEREVTWSSSILPPSILVTAFIYGPKGLIGFIRRDKYYSVITDHEGSTRLIVKDGEVVAAYDYSPYGTLMRQFGSNPEAHISYRYTGQEWDEEIDLYNYHARFYDPSIGRFYQHDPKMQYFSPYKYAGNSPVSLIDHDGEFAFVLILLIAAVLAAAGAYLGGASVSGTWNIAKWNFKDPKLYEGIILGGIGGALMPVAIPLSIEAIGPLAVFALGVTGAAAGMVSSANDWRPWKWDFSRPELWNGAFEGIQTFAEAPVAISSGVSFYKSLSTVAGKSAFLGGVFLSAGTKIGLRAINRGYDFSKPESYYDLFESISFSADIPMFATSGFRFLRKNVKFSRNTLRDLTHQFNKVREEGIIIKSLSKFAARSAIPSLAAVLVNVPFLVDGIDFTEPTTYEVLINNLMTVSSFSSHGHQSTAKFLLGEKEKIPKILHDRAKESVTEYSKQLKESEPIATASKEVENTVVGAAVMNDGTVFIAYSGLSGSGGFLSAFNYKDKSFFSFLYKGETFHRLLPKNNDIIGNSKFAIDDIRDGIQARLDAEYIPIKESNYATYLMEKDNLITEIKEKMSELDLDLASSIDDTYIQSILQPIQEEIKSQGYPKKNTFDGFITPVEKKNKKFNTDFIQKMQNKLTEINKKGVQQNGKLILPKEQLDELDSIYHAVKTEVDKGILYELEPLGHNENHKEKILQMRNILGDVKKAKSRQIKNFQKKLTSLFNTHFSKAKFPDGLVPWKPINCAEPHCIIFSKRAPEIIKNTGKSYNINDVKYLGAYQIVKKPIKSVATEGSSNGKTGIKPNENVATSSTNNDLGENGGSSIDKPGTKPVKEAPSASDQNGGKTNSDKGIEFFLQEKERCKNCKITTEPVKYVVTDESWKSMIELEMNKIKGMFVLNFHTTFTHPYVHNITENINSAFGWMSTSLKQLIDSTKILPEKASIPTMVKRITNSNNNLTAATASVDINSTLLLVDTLMRKVTGQKHFSGAAANDLSLLEARGYSLDVGLAFERSLKYAASKSGISMHRFNIHYIDIQEKVIDKIMSGKFDEIAETLNSHAEKACPQRENGCPGKLGQRKFNKFMTEFSKKIDTELNEILQSHKIIKRV